MEKVYKKQICYKLCSFLPTIFVLVLFSFFLISESSLSLLTTLVALSSTMFLITLTRKKSSIGENLVQDNPKKLDSSKSSISGNDVDETDKRHEQQGEASQIDSSFPSIMDKNLELNAIVQDSDSSELPSDSETSTTCSIKSEGFENDHITNQNHGISDILDYDNDYDDNDEEEEEDSLIEIKLPNSSFFGLNADGDNEDHKQQLECNNFPDFLPESIFKHKCLIELLEEMNEINEDDNLIEIDLSIGSTKCQDLKMKQELAYYGDQCVISD